SHASTDRESGPYPNEVPVYGDEEYSLGEFDLDIKFIYNPVTDVDKVHVAVLIFIELDEKHEIVISPTERGAQSQGIGWVTRRMLSLIQEENLGDVETWTKTALEV